MSTCKWSGLRGFNIGRSGDEKDASGIVVSLTPSGKVGPVFNLGGESGLLRKSTDSVRELLDSELKGLVEFDSEELVFGLLLLAKFCCIVTVFLVGLLVLVSFSSISVRRFVPSNLLWK